MGTPEFAVPPLERLIEFGHQVVAVVTQPDKPVGRGRKMHHPPVKDAALRNGIPVLQPAKIRNCRFDDVLRPFQPDAIAVVAYGKIIPPEVLSLPRFGCLNIHASLLPKYRGAAPIQWAIINSERRTGVTIMQLDEGMDTGPVIAMEDIEILNDDDTISLSNMLSVLGGKLLTRILDQVEASGRVESQPQDHALASYAPIMKKSDGLIDWSLTNEQIICRINGLKPWPTAFSFLGDSMWKFLRTEPFDDPDHLYFTAPDAPKTPHGSVTALARGRGFTIKTGDGHLLVTSIQPQGKRLMSGVDTINGKQIKIGDQFISNPELLDRAGGD